MQYILCCFKTIQRPNLINIPETKDNFDEICVRIKKNTPKDNDSFHINEWIQTIDKPITLKDTIEFVPPIDTGIVIKVYDGDTITIASKLPYEHSHVYRFLVRLNGIDCPEIKSKDEQEKICAQKAKQALTELVLNKIVTLKNLKTEKYGRILADVYLNDLHLNKYMLDNKFAIPYDGGKKS